MQNRQKPGLSNAMIEQSIDPLSNKAKLPLYALHDSFYRPFL